MSPIQEIEGIHVYLGQHWISKEEPTTRAFILNRWDREKDELFLVGNGPDEDFAYGTTVHKGRRINGHNLITNYIPLD